MPIHDQGYRRYGGERASQGRAWTVIATAGVKTMFARRILLGLLLLAWMPFFVRAVQLYAAASFPQAAFLAPSAETFREFLEQQNTFVFFVTVFVGAGLISNDHRANALQIYLSKPLTRAEYIAGKFATLLLFLLLVTWLPAILLLVVQMAFAGSLDFLSKNLYLVPAITLFAFVQVIVASSAMLALSSLSKSSRYVAILYTALIFFSKAVAGVLLLVNGNSRFAWLSIPSNLTQVGDVIFRLPPRYDVPWVVSLLIVVAIVVVSGVVLERRVRGVEVVA